MKAMKVLIIDDEPHIRQMMRLTLEASGYEVDEAGSGEDGLTRLGDGHTHDVVVLDQKMPGIDGLETLRRIRARAADARVVMITAFASVELAVDAMKLGAMDFLRKPMTPEMLRGAVSAALSSDRATRPAPAAGSVAKPEIQILTLNGFQIIPPAGPRDPSASQHNFRVKNFKDGSEVPVTVAIDPEAVSRVERLTRRRLEPGGAFWRGQAERLLSAYLWTEGQLPPGALTVDDVSREDLEVATNWETD
jgi:DNA-binding response OmpR family regulator